MLNCQWMNLAGMALGPGSRHPGEGRCLHSRMKLWSLHEISARLCLCRDGQCCHTQVSGLTRPLGLHFAVSWTCDWWGCIAPHAQKHPRLGYHSAVADLKFILNRRTCIFIFHQAPQHRSLVLLRKAPLSAPLPRLWLQKPTLLVNCSTG